MPGCSPPVSTSGWPPSTAPCTPSPRRGWPTPPATPPTGQLFRIRPGRHGHQHYLICRNCRRSVTVTSAAVERWASALGRRHGFTGVQHVIEVTGFCATCAGETDDHT